MGISRFRKLWSVGSRGTADTLDRKCTYFHINFYFLCKSIIFLKTTLEKRQFLDQENRMISQTVNIFASGIALKTNLSKPYKFVNSRGTRAFKRPQKCQNRVNSGFWSTPYSETLHVGGVMNLTISVSCAIKNRCYSNNVHISHTAQLALRVCHSNWDTDKTI